MAQQTGIREVKNSGGNVSYWAAQSPGDGWVYDADAIGWFNPNDARGFVYHDKGPAGTSTVLPNASQSSAVQTNSKPLLVPNGAAGGNAGNPGGGAAGVGGGAAPQAGGVPQVSWNAGQWDATGNNSVRTSDQLNYILDENGRYIQSARARGTETAAARGLLNSSLAAGSAERAAIDAALPIAQGNAQTYTNRALQDDSLRMQGMVTSAELAARAREQQGAFEQERQMFERQAQQQRDMALLGDEITRGQMGYESVLLADRLRLEAGLDLQTRERLAQIDLETRQTLALLDRDNQIAINDALAEANRITQGSSVIAQSQLDFSTGVSAILQNPNLSPEQMQRAINDYTRVYTQVTLPRLTALYGVDLADIIGETPQTPTPGGLFQGGNNGLGLTLTEAQRTLTPEQLEAWRQRAQRILNP